MTISGSIQTLFATFKSHSCIPRSIIISKPIPFVHTAFPALSILAFIISIKWKSAALLELIK